MLRCLPPGLPLIWRYHSLHRHNTHPHRGLTTKIVRNTVQLGNKGIANRELRSDGTGNLLVVVSETCGSATRKTTTKTQTDCLYCLCVCVFRCMCVCVCVCLLCFRCNKILSIFHFHALFTALALGQTVQEFSFSRLRRGWPATSDVPFACSRQDRTCSNQFTRSRRRWFVQIFTQEVVRPRQNTDTEVSFKVFPQPNRPTAGQWWSTFSVNQTGR